MFRLSCVLLASLALLGCGSRSSPRGDGGLDADADGLRLDAFEELLLRREGGLGFCPPVGADRELWVAQIPEGGRYGFSGTYFAEGDPETEDCLAGVDGSRCVVSRFINIAVMPAERSAELEAMVEALPTEPCGTDPACDPCLIEVVRAGCSPSAACQGRRSSPHPSM